MHLPLQKTGYHAFVHPSYVLGGRAMEIVYSDDKLVIYLENAVEVDPECHVLIDNIYHPLLSRLI